MATADMQVKCFIIRQIVYVLGHKVNYYTSLCFIYLSFYFFFKIRKRVGSALTLTDIIVEAAEGEKGGSQDSIIGQRGHTLH